jgi:hypothetical protein
MSFNGDLYPTAGADVVMTTKGDLVRYDSQRERYGIGSTNQVLSVTAGLPAWKTLTTADSVLTTQGDILYEGASGLARLGQSTDGFVLTTKGASADPVWAAAGGITESSIQSTTPVTDNAEVAYGTANQFIQPFTLPTTEKLYVISDIEWKNGSTVAGEIMCGCWSTNTSHEDRAPLACLGRKTTASGADSTQSCGAVSPNLWRGGTAGFIFGHCSDNAHTIRRQTGLSSERATISTAYTTDPPTFMNTNATASTAHPYLIIKFYGYS